MKKQILIIIMLLLNLLTFADIPHSYIYENPTKEVTTTETLKRKPNGAEMNISVTKIKTQEIEGTYSKETKEIYLTINELSKTDKVIVTTNLKDIKDPQKLILSNNKIKYKYNYPDIDIPIKGISLNSKIYIVVLDSMDNLRFIKRLARIKEEKLILTTIIDKFSDKITKSNQVIFQFMKDYMWNTNQVITGEHISELTKDVEISFGAFSQPYGSHRGHNRYGNGKTYIEVKDANGTILETKENVWWTYIGGDSKPSIPTRVYYAKKFNRPVTVKLRWSLDLGGYTAHYNGGRADMSVIRRIEQTFKYIVAPLEGTSNLTFDEKYSKNLVEFSSTSYDLGNPLSVEKQIQGLTFSTTGAGIITMEQGDKLDINGVQVIIGTGGNLTEKITNIGSLGLKYKVENGKLRLGLNNWGVLEPLRKVNIKVIRGTKEITNHIFNIQAPKRIEGNSRITLKEYYPKNSYLAFNSININSPIPLALENSIKDVILENSIQYGIIQMKQGDILDINGVRSTIVTSGNLAEKTQSIDTMNFKYKVENGKLRLALINWGTLEPRRNIIVKVIRGTNEISKHTINIKSPTKVEGDTILKFDNTYQIRSFAKFKGVDLSMPEFLVLENHQGVILENTIGSGIPYMNEGDKLFISENIVKSKGIYSNNSFVIGSSGMLDKKSIKLTNGEIGLQVTNGKLNVALNNWIVNKNINVRVQVVRGTNEIMDHIFTFKSPDAPFNIVEQGVLDFGTIISGAKNKKAETNIRIEMLKDVSSIQFNLNTNSPELYNENGSILKVKKIETLVSKESKRKYKIKVFGNLDIPKNQELGAYSGTAILEMRIK